MKDHDKQFIKTITEDFAERRIEGAISSFNKLFLAHKDEMQKAVRDEIKLTVNGKIDALRQENREYHEKQQVEMEKLKDSLTNLKTETLPAVESITFFKLLKKFILWVTPLGILLTWIKWIR